MLHDIHKQSKTYDSLAYSVAPATTTKPLQSPKSAFRISQIGLQWLGVLVLSLVPLYPQLGLLSGRRRLQHFPASVRHHSLPLASNPAGFPCRLPGIWGNWAAHNHFYLCTVQWLLPA